MRTPLERFTEKYVVSDTDCWEWFAATNQQGRPMFSHAGKSEPAQRFSYRQYVGDIAPLHEIITTCSIRHCVNPAHLVEVSRTEHRMAQLAHSALGTHEQLKQAHRLLNWFARRFPAIDEESARLREALDKPAEDGTSIWQRITASRLLKERMHGR